MATKKKMLQAAAGVGGAPEGAWDLSYAYYDDPNGGDLSTVLYTGKSATIVKTYETNPNDLFFKPDGTKFYITGTSGDDVTEFNLSTAWDVSTASYVQSFSVAGQDTAPEGLFFKPDGTKMYVCGSTSDAVHEYDISTAWDVSTASYVQSFSVSAQSGFPTSVFFKPDGTKLYMTDISNRSVFEYDLSTAWDISTASFLQSFSIFAQVSAAESVFFLAEGTRMYVVDSSADDITSYALSTPWDVSTATFITQFGVSGQMTIPTGVFFTPDGLSMYMCGSATDYVFQYALGGFSIAAQETEGSDVFFKPDGTKMYVLGFTGDDVNEYTLSTAWDTSTASYTQAFSVAAQETAPGGLFFKPDGTKMYVTGFSGDDVNEYSLSTAWDVSTSSYIQSFSVAGQDTAPRTTFFKPDGTKMYVVGASGQDINEYSLSTAWDISTASYAQNFSVAAQETAPWGLFFKSDGTKMYVVGSTGDDVNEYDLSTAWDISTASYLQSFSVDGLFLSPGGLFFKDDGTQMFIVDSTRDAIYTVTLGVQP